MSFQPLGSGKTQRVTLSEIKPNGLETVSEPNLLGKIGAGMPGWRRAPWESMWQGLAVGVNATASVPRPLCHGDHQTGLSPSGWPGDAPASSPVAKTSSS